MNLFENDENEVTTYDEFKANVLNLVRNNEIDPDEVDVNDSEIRKCYDDNMDYRSAVYLYIDAHDLQ